MIQVKDGLLLNNGHLIYHIMTLNVLFHFVEKLRHRLLKLEGGIVI